MEKKHRQRMLEKFPEESASKPIINLDIPDNYTFMDPELVEEITEKMKVYIPEL